MRTRWGFGALAIVAALTAGCLGGAAAAPPASPPSGRNLVAYSDPHFGWTVRYPHGMRVGHFQGDGRFTFDGEWLANFPADISSEASRCCGEPDMARLREFPRHGVALAIWFGEGLPAPPPLRDSTFPVSRSSFHAIARYVRGREPVPRYAELAGDGTRFAVAVWFGPAASTSARRAIWSVVQSLRFPPLQTGTIRDQSFYVLGLANSYPVGSVTDFTASSLPVGGPYLQRPSPFFLVHAPRAFYAIPETFMTPGGSTCGLVYDPRSLRFSCPGTSLEWDRAGRPLGSDLVTAGPDRDALGLHIATIAQDGHVLYDPDFGALLPLVLKGDPWA